MCEMMTTRAALLIDLERIRVKLSDVEIDSPKIYKAIHPLTEHLIEHLRNVILWIDEKKDDSKKQPSYVSDNDLFAEWWREINGENNSMTKYVIARQAWMRAKGLQSFN